MLAKASKSLRRLLIENLPIVIRNTATNYDYVDIDMGSLEGIHVGEAKLHWMALSGTAHNIKARIYTP